MVLQYVVPLSEAEHKSGSPTLAHRTMLWTRNPCASTCITIQGVKQCCALRLVFRKTFIIEKCQEFTFLPSLLVEGCNSYLTVSGPQGSVALSVIYRVTVGPRHAPDGPHLVAVATGHRTLEGNKKHTPMRTDSQTRRVRWTA